MTKFPERNRFVVFECLGMRTLFEGLFFVGLLDVPIGRGSEAVLASVEELVPVPKR